MNQNTVITFSNRLQLYSTALIGTAVLYSSVDLRPYSTAPSVCTLITPDLVLFYRLKVIISGQNRNLLIYELTVHPKI